MKAVNNIIIIAVKRSVTNRENTANFSQTPRATAMLVLSSMTVDKLNISCPYILSKTKINISIMPLLLYPARKRFPSLFAQRETRE